MSLEIVSSVGGRFVLLTVFGALLLPGCRSNKSDYSFASPRQPTPVRPSTSIAPGVSQSSVAADTLPVMTPPPAASSYAPVDFSPTPEKSSGCSSGCCSG